MGGEGGKKIGEGGLGGCDVVWIGYPTVLSSSFHRRGKEHAVARVSPFLGRFSAL